MKKIFLDFTCYWHLSVVLLNGLLWTFTYLQLLMIKILTNIQFMFISKKNGIVFLSNVLFEVTNVWSNSNSNPQIYSADFSNVSDFDNYNSNNLQYQDNRGYVELKHQFSNCNSLAGNQCCIDMQLILVRNQIELIQG